MKKTIFIILALSLGVYFVGCGRKEAALDETREPLSMEALTMTTTDTKAPIAATTKTTAAKLEPLPPAGPYRPTSQEIQTALRNAGFYAGLIDGKMGSLTKKAVEDFQNANKLEVDGKVGPKTWELLSTYLKVTPEKKTKKRN